MKSQNPGISAQPVKVFLNAVDQVLNSNTFLLQFNIYSNRVEESLLNFLNSESFIKQLVQQDIERGWYNLHYFDNETKSYRIRQGNILKDNFQLKIVHYQLDKREYLIAMLTGDTTKGRFFSFYSKQVDKEKAETIVDNMIIYLSFTTDWELYIVEPDFLKVTDEINSKDLTLTYFEGDDGNNSATLLIFKDKGFLILTNGID